MQRRPRSIQTLVAERVNARIAEAVEANFVEIIVPLLRKAKEGDVMAIKELLDRGLGKATQAVSLEVETKKLIQDDAPKAAIPSTIQALGANVYNDD